jgi:hypothetical protein
MNAVIQRQPTDLAAQASPDGVFGIDTGLLKVAHGLLLGIYQALLKRNMASGHF